ncbi:MAG: thrombospondin type 3 repeat-containing protein [Sandaracinaceae bacterium]
MRPTLSAFVGLLLGAALLGAPQGALAQTETQQFSVLRFSPAPGARNYAAVDGAATPGHLTGTAGVVIDYAHDPFVILEADCDENGENCELTSTRSRIVRYTAVAHLLGTLTLFDRLQIGAVVPLALASGDPFSFISPAGPVELRGGDAFAIADPRLHLKGNLFHDRDLGIGLAATFFVTFPTGQAFTDELFLGEPTPTFGGNAVFELTRGPFGLAANLGGVWRQNRDLFSTQVGPQLTYGFAARYDITPIVGLFAELTGASGLSDQVDENTLEWRAGGHLRYGDTEAYLGAGTGLVRGVGVPSLRIVAGFRWAPVRTDTDGDGVVDGVDRCPTEPEDIDDWYDEDGCPEPDNDEDGLLDGEDPCPREAEDVDGVEDEDGCPDPDNDGDGIEDGYDGCPFEPEDVDGDRDTDGCPDNDRDEDGIADPLDQCVDAAEDFDGFADADGCPEDDVDLDRVDDPQDLCPEEPEDLDGDRDEDGCPD